MIQTDSTGLPLRYQPRFKTVTRFNADVKSGQKSNHVNKNVMYHLIWIKEPIWQNIPVQVRHTALLSCGSGMGRSYPTSSTIFLRSKERTKKFIKEATILTSVNFSCFQNNKYPSSNCLLVKWWKFTPFIILYLCGW